MKKKKWSGIFGDIDDKFIEEAAPDATRVASKKKLWLRLGALAACVCLLVGANLWLFLPFSTTAPDVSRYSGSEYYGIIERLNEYAFVAPKHRNNAAWLSASIGSFFKSLAPPLEGGAAGGSDGATEFGPTNEGGTYIEVTDNQVAGVIEGDRVKRSDTHIYHLRGKTLRIYSIAGENSAELSSFELFADKAISYVSENNEMYLSDDCKTVTVFFGYTTDKYKRFVDIISLDVTSPTAVTERTRVTVSGTPNTSRLSDGALLALINYSPSLKSLDFSNEDSFLPTVSRDGERVSIPAENIVYPETLTDGRYTVVIKLDGATLDISGVGAFLSYADNVYVTKTTVYATRGYRELESIEGASYAVNKAKTEICALGYDGELALRGRVSVNGTVNDQYSLDEHEGILRAVTSTNEMKTRLPDSDFVGDFLDPVLRSASLYCIDVSDMSVKARIENFCPSGEEVTSARFAGDTAYVCTANKVQYTDPVYFFDLSDLENITYKDTGTIDGYSTSLVDFGEGLLLGIGVGSWRGTVKVEIYEEGEELVESVCSFESDGYISESYKAHYIDRERSLVGIAVHNLSYDGIKTQGGVTYLLLAFDGFELAPIETVWLDATDTSLVRAFIDGGFLYILSENGLAVRAIFES